LALVDKRFSNYNINIFPASETRINEPSDFKWSFYPEDSEAYHIRYNGRMIGFCPPDVNKVIFLDIDGVITTSPVEKELMRRI